MKKYHYKSGVFVIGILLHICLNSCTDWLGVEPVDKVVESQIFSSEVTIQQALNGIYLKMGTNALYGRALSVEAIELLGQQYNSGDAETMRTYMLQYNYTTDLVKGKLLSIWSESYAAILDINNFIVNLNKTEDLIAPDRKDILLGEAYALRAYIHLDLLRLFGPVYYTDSTDIAIPYRKEPQIEYAERITASEVMDHVMDDLNISLDLLKNDPVITEGTMAVVADSLSASQKKIDPFYRNRNRRMNYYAAATLKARALMYRNNPSAAAALAKTLLESSAIPDKFPWAKNDDVIRNTQEDRIFSKEVIFGVHASNMYNNWTALFSPGITSLRSVYASLAANTAELYEISVTDFPNCTDWRSKNWKSYTSDGTYMVTYKLSKSVKETLFWYFQPLIRKSELYYILAECENDVNYVDEVRSHRNIKKVQELRPTYNLDTEIRNEFLREMHNEGQIFYFYKRKFLREIPSGTTTGTVEMTKARYVVPIPQREIDK